MDPEWRSAPRERAVSYPVRMSPTDSERMPPLGVSMSQPAVLITASFWTTGGLEDPFGGRVQGSMAENGGHEEPRREKGPTPPAPPH